MKDPVRVRTHRRPVPVSGPFRFSWSAVGGCVVVRIAGRVDDAGTLAAELRQVIVTKQPTVVVDLRRVELMHDAGIDVLLAAHEFAVRHGGWLRLACAGEILAELIGDRARHYPSLADALPSYRPAATQHRSAS